jgi:hypothetical protein
MGIHRFIIRYGIYVAEKAQQVTNFQNKLPPKRRIRNCDQRRASKDLTDRNLPFARPPVLSATRVSAQRLELQEGLISTC